MEAAGSTMRFTPLFLLVLPLLGAGWLSPKAASRVSLVALQPVTATPSHEEPLDVREAPSSARSAAVDPVTRADAIETPPLPGIEAFTAAELPLLPINTLFDEDATPARYAEWYGGTPIEHLYQSMVRFHDLRNWDPKTCPCAGPDPLFQHTETHRRLHALYQQGKLLRREEAWLCSEVRRQMSADLKSGGSLQVFRLPKTEALFGQALEESSIEELKVLGQMIIDAKGAARSAAVEAEFAAGNFKVGAHGVWG
jgi:hypothetical protein